VPNSLFDKEKFKRPVTCNDFVRTADGEPGFLNTIITEGESWFVLYDAEMER
jgi:hypothetical protein